MKATDIKINLYKRTNSKLKAFVDITLDDAITLKGWKIVDGAKGLFLAPPSRPGKDGQYYDDIYFPNSKEEGTPGAKFRNYLQQAVLKQYGLGAEETSFDQTAQEDTLPF